MRELFRRVLVSPLMDWQNLGRRPLAMENVANVKSSAESQQGIPSGCQKRV